MAGTRNPWEENYGANDGQDTGAKPWEQAYQQPEPPKAPDGPLARGWNKAKQSMSITSQLATGNAAGAAQTIKQADDYARANPGMQEGEELGAAWDRGDGISGGISEVAGEFAKDWREAPGVIKGLRATGRNLRALGERVVEQVPNMAAPVTGMVGGALAGSAAGSAAPIVGNVAGAAVGGWVGASAGNTLVEGGGMTQAALQKAGISPQDTAAVEKYLTEHGDTILGQSATKGAIIGAADTLTAGLGGRLLNAPARAAADRALAGMGVNMADKAAVKAATQSPEFAAKIAGDATYQASKQGAGNIARNVGAAALDPAGEFAGEFVGQGVATGEWDTKNAALEAFSSIGQSGAMFAGQKAYQAFTRPGTATNDPSSQPATAPVQPPEPQASTQGTGPTLALPAPDRGVIQVSGDGTARTPAYQTPGYVGDVTDVEPRAVNPVREQVAAAAEQGGALSSAALMAIDTGLSDAMQPAPEQAPPQIRLEEADARDRAAYEQFFASADAEPVVARYFENDDDIPDFDAASNVSDEDFLRALGATDEDIQDAIATTRQPASPQGSAAVDAGAQANEPAGTGQGAGADQAAQGQVAPRQPSNFTGTPTATMGQQGATARPGPGFGLKDALAQIRAKKQQEAANAQAATPEAAPATTSVPAAGTGAVEAAGPATNIKTITAKLQKEVQRRAAQTTQGSTNATQTAQAKQASPQPAQTGAAPSAAPGQASPAAPAGTPEVRALSDGISVTPGKGLIKGKFLSSVDGDGTPGGPWTTEEDARNAALQWKKTKETRAIEAVEDRNRKDSYLQKLRSGHTPTAQEVEGLGLRASGADLTYFIPRAADLFGITSREVRPLIADLIRVGHTDMGAKRESVNPMKALAQMARAGTNNTQGSTDGTTIENPGAQAAPAAGAQGKAPRATPEQLTEAGAAWTRMPTAERQALAERTDVKPVLKKNLPGAQWENLHVDVRRKLAAAMTPAAQPAENAEQPRHDGRYELPAGSARNAVNDEWSGSIRPDFKPSPRQQLVMDAVAQALDDGAFYNRDVDERVARALKVTPEQRARNTKGVEGGDFGYDVYLARKAVEAQRGNAKSQGIARELNLMAGDVLGTLVFNDGKVTTGVTIKSLNETGLVATIAGKRGAAVIEGEVGVDAIASALDRAKERGKRKDGYVDMVAQRSKSPAGRASAPETAPQQAAPVDVQAALAGAVSVDHLSPADLDTVAGILGVGEKAESKKQAAEPRPAKEKPEDKAVAPDRFANNKLFTADKVAAARERMRKKLGTLNSGIDPELLVDGMTVAGAYIESGVRNFTQYAKAMIEDMGDGVKPYLLSFWEGARSYPGLDNAGMTDPAESSRQHQALLTTEAREQAAERLGEAVANPTKRTKKTGAKGDMTLTQDWGVEHIDGYSDGTRGEIGNATKDAFLKEARQYLNAVASELAVAGFEPHADRKGKPGKAVNVNESGMAGSGDVSLTVRDPESGTNLYVRIGDSALRGMFPSTPSGIAVMARTSQAAGDTDATKGQNRWMPVDLSASDLSALLLRDARVTMEAQTRTNQPKETPNGNPEQAGRAADQGRAPEVSGRGGRNNDSAAPADSGDLEGRQPGDVPAPADAGRSGGDGVRVPAADVGRAGQADEVGNAGDGRARASGAPAPDAGAGKKRSVKAPEEVSPANPGPGNFHLDNPLEIVGGTPVARFDKNTAAIELLNTLRESERQATAEEQRTLAGYTGWGSFGQELFQGTWAKPMPKQGWEKRDQWLRDHLGQDEWESAQRSITNAHYTDPPTVMAMWDMVKRMGFGGGRVLEPSMGIGNFFGMMPADIKSRSQLAGIELDSLTGAMATRLYPDANIKVMGYQESKTPDNFYDVVIGNWPFENTVIADRRYNTLSPFLHDYFFLKALDQVRPGGLVVGITSNGTMDKKATRIRAALARKAELVTSIRLPSGAFKEYAGTSVVTDIVILKKRDKPLSLTPNEPWINSVAVKTTAGPEVFINEFYAQNPGNVIGTTDYGHGTTRMQPGMIVHRPENMAERLRDAVNLVPEGVFTKEDRTEHISYVTNHTADREGSLSEQNGALYVVRGEHLAPAQDVRKYALKSEAATAKREQELRALIDMRRKYAALIEAERDGNADSARKTLRDAYEAFGKEHGNMADSFGLDYLRKIDDPFYPALAALTVNGKPSDILSKSTIRGARGIKNPTPQDAYVLARNKSVEPSLSEIAALAGKPEAEVLAALVKSGAVFEAPNGDVVPSDIYLSGNVRQKLREAQAALDDGNKAMERNVAELKKVIPEDVPYFNIESQLGATWVPAKAYAEYVAHMLNRPSADGIEATFLNGRWKIRLPDGANHWTEARTGFGTGEYPFSKLVNAAFTNQTVKIRRKDSEGNEYVDTEATDEANARIGDIRTKFGEWLWSDPERRASLEAEYNESRNAYATPKYDGSFLSFEGMALSLGRGPFSLRQHQVNAIWRALVNRRSLNAHEVGTGKTFTMGGIAVESRRYGIAKKPVLLAHNANSASVAAEIQQMYPAAKVLYIDNLDKDSIAVRMRQIANDDWDTIVMPHSLIDRLSLREETLMEMAREDIRALEEEAYAAAKEDGARLTAEMMDDEDELKKVRSVTAKELVKARNRIIETIKKQAMQSSREGAIPFEDLGIDMVLVDEAHEFKKPPISTRMNMKGLNTQTSNRSIALQFITRYIRANNFGGNVHTFTGTPITNTLTEIFHQMRYVMEDEMKAVGVESWDGWFGSFAKEVQDVELSAAVEYEAINRLAGFINVPELRRMIGQYMDVVFADDMPEMQPRKVNGKTLTSADLSEAERAELLNGRTENAADRPYKKVINVTSDLTDEQSRIFAELQGYARRWRNMSGKERMEAMRNGSPESPIITEGLANKASFDVRLMQDEAYAGQEGSVPDSPGSKASKVVGNVLEIYNSDDRAAQVIFAEQGFSTSKDKSMGRDPSGKKITRRAKTFSTMRDIVERLVQGGIPREQIAIVDGSTSKEKRKEIADAMNALTVRVVIGSTDTLGVGVNMQRNLRAMHHMDAPYMPGELEQRNGRGLRQGNQWNTVLEYRYMTDRLDGRRWQILAIKQRFITAFMKANSDSRVIEGDAASDEESDIVQSFSEAAGDPRILIRAKLRKNVEALQRAERMHGNGVADARRNMRNAKEAIEWNRGVLQKMTANGLPQRLRAMMQAQSEGFVATVQGKAYDARKDAEEAIDKFLRTEMRMEQSGVKVATYRDQTITARWPSLSSQPELVMEVDGQEFSSGGLRGLEQQVRNFPGRIEKIEGVIAKHEASIERLDQVSRAPFARAADLENAVKRLAALEKDIEVNPVPPPAWLRAGAPVDSEAFRGGLPFVVTGHRWTKDGWFVLGQDAKGEMAIPYNEVMDAQGMPLYEEREFQAPEVIEKEDKSAAPAAPSEDAANFEGATNRRPGTATDRAIMDMVRTGEPARDILGLIAESSGDPWRRELARRLLQSGANPSVRMDRGALGEGAGFAFLAKYSRTWDELVMTPGAQRMAEQIFLHEMVHAATLKSLDRKGLHSLQMRRLFEHVQATGALSGHYGMKNVGEFVAEAFTNPKFQEALRQLPAPKGGVLQNAWDALVRIVRSIVGLPQRDQDALARALKLGAEVMREDKALRARGVRGGGGDAHFGSADLGDRMGAAIKSVTATGIKQRAGFKATDYLGLGLQALGRRQIVDIYGDMLPLAEYNQLVTQMEADKNEGGAEADQLVTRWAKLPDEAKLADLMHDATLAQIDPAKPYVDGDDKARYMTLQGRFNALSAEAKQVYTDTRDSYQAHHARVRSAIKERIERSEIKGERKAALLKQMDDEFFKAIKGVYFPLARFGQYAVTVKGPDGKVESVSRAEAKDEAEALRNNLLAAFPRDKGFTVGRVMLSKEFIADRDAVGRGFMTELYQVLDKQDMDAAQRAELEDTLGQLYLSSLPDLSWAKHGIHRKGTPGFSQDARRAFAQNMFHGARYLAKLRYSDLMQDQLAAMQKHVDDWREVENFDQNSAQRVVDEMNKRHESLMNPKSNPLSTALTSLGFVFHLGLSPASAMVNLSQTALVAYPIMGAKWGFGKASAALLKASKQAAAGKNDITGSLNADERAAYDEAVRAGTIDVTMAHDLAGIAQGEDAGVMWKLRPVMRWASFLFHNAERFNRQVTFVAAYRLAREAGAESKVAFEQATKATYDGHFDYGAANRPRVMQGNVAKVLLLFKQYGQNMVYTLSRNAYQSIKGTDAEKAEARKVLAGLLTSHAMAAGVLGLPMVTTLLAAASMIGGDDDEPWDAKVALQNLLADTFGQKPAEVLAHGLSRLTPWDISGRVGLDKLIFPDVQEGLEGQRLAESAMAAALGPVAGIGVNLLKGMQMMGEGRYAMGLEAMMPAALRGPVKALRYAEEGVQDKSGISILDEVSPAAIAGQALGFSPSAARNAQEGKSAILAQDRALSERRQELLTKIARATMAKDEETKAEAREEIRLFNEKNPGRRINPNHIMASVHGRQKRIDQAQDGVYLPRNRREAMEVGRFATSE